ncbi:hypothetical protein COK59_09470 [Bacillus thuringiensis]|uniref:hypothetical protein n=1 Tax=Bacillus cereus TaxID=1396 RepID=UPI000BEE215F|nr:hypothetical protein [Bacillus cereus]PDZ62193.1 hypothetical protein CON29_15965 [Bacillus thuringiensis]PFT09122.1 hypothetical protein COK59_09470 [Bacillus thuringiensis]PGU15441.1 hypothetical protein COD23_20505 [Bacillus thuringiensis]
MIKVEKIQSVITRLQLLAGLSPLFCCQVRKLSITNVLLIRGINQFIIYLHSYYKKETSIKMSPFYTIHIKKVFNCLKTMKKQ